MLKTNGSGKQTSVRRKTMLLTFSFYCLTSVHSGFIFYNKTNNTYLFRRPKNTFDRVNKESSEFEIKIGLKQGCLLSPLLFFIVIDDAIKKSKRKCTNIKIGNLK